MADKILTIKMDLKLAEMDDFTHYKGSLNPNAKNVGKPFVLRNSVGRLEFYTVGPSTNLESIERHLNAGKVYVFDKISANE